MGHLPFAFSVHHFINSVGSDAGFASIIGLAILVLLYFAHARETAALRDQAEEASLRVQALEARVAQLGRIGHQPPSAAPAPAPTAQGTASPAPARPLGAPIPAPAPAAPAVRAPAPVSAAALAAASAGAGAATAYPAGAQASGVAPATAQAPAARAAAPPAPGAQAPGAQAPAAQAPAAQAPTGAPAGVGAPPLTAATRLIPGATAVAARTAAEAQTPESDADAGVPAPVAAAGGVRPGAVTGSNGTSEHAVVPPPRPSASRPPVQIRPGAVDASNRVAGAPPRGAAPGRGRADFFRRALPVLIAALALAAIVAVLLSVTSGGSNKTAASSSTPTSNAPATHHRAAPKAFNPATVTVAVLNGTPTNGLARRISTRLAAGGFKQGNIKSATDQTRTATVVAYMPGHRADAIAVAKALKLGSASVNQIDPGTQTIACTPPSACAATVVVTVGADLANQ